MLSTLGNGAVEREGLAVVQAAPVLTHAHLLLLELGC